MEKRYRMDIEIKGHTFPYGITQNGELIPMHDTSMVTTEENVFDIASSLIGPIRKLETPSEYDELLKDIHNYIFSKETSISIYDDGGLVAKYM